LIYQLAKRTFWLKIKATSAALILKYRKTDYALFALLVEDYSTVIAFTGHELAASSAHDSSVSGAMTSAFPSSAITKTLGQRLSQTPQPIHMSLSRVTFAIQKHLHLFHMIYQPGIL